MGWDGRGVVEWDGVGLVWCGIEGVVGLDVKSGVGGRDGWGLVCRELITSVIPSPTVMQDRGVVHIRVANPKPKTTKPLRCTYVIDRNVGSEVVNVGSGGVNVGSGGVNVGSGGVHVGSGGVNVGSGGD